MVCIAVKTSRASPWASSLLCCAARWALTMAATWSSVFATPVYTATRPSSVSAIYGAFRVRKGSLTCGAVVRTVKARPPELRPGCLDRVSSPFDCAGTVPVVSRLDNQVRGPQRSALVDRDQDVLFAILLGALYAHEFFAF